MKPAYSIGIAEGGHTCPPSLVIRSGALEQAKPQPLFEIAPARREGTAPEELAFLRASARGDRVAFKALYDRYAPRLGRYVLRLVQRREMVGEVVNDAMLVAWQSAARFDPGKSRLSSWLFGIAHNKALQALERMGARREDALEEDDPGADGASVRTPEEAAIGRQTGAALARALEGLSPNHRAVIELAFAEGCSYQEIADITGSPLNTVKTRMFHARKHLLQLLEEGNVR